MADESEKGAFAWPGGLPPQAHEEPGRVGEGRPVEPLVGALRAARRHDDVAALPPHVEAGSEPTRAASHLLLCRVSEEDVRSAAARARLRRLGERASRALQLGEALR